ncbi:MAG TPA: tryptophan synthase subunit alpha, partial [Candidatus Saccharimonadales bacterium]
MCHVVAGYPDAGDCLELMAGLHALGVEAIEVQIPFSDPIADGEPIMGANDIALAGGMTTAGSFDLIQKGRQQGVDTDIYIMSYVQKINHYGLAEFCEQSAACNIKGLIVPDLPYDSPESDSLRNLLKAQGIQLVPVLSPGMPESRLQALMAFKPACVYLTSRRGITGNKYTPARQLKQLAAGIEKSGKTRVMIGFGIATPADVNDALQIGDTVVVGSAIVQAIQSSGTKGALVY